MSRQKSKFNPVIIIIAITIILIINLIKNAVGLYQSRQRLEQARQSAAKLEQSKQELEQEIALKSNPASLDQIIRDKLNLAKPGDTIVIVNTTDSANASASAQINLDDDGSSSLPNIIQWWRLLCFGT